MSQPMPSTKPFVIIPTYNEAQNIEGVTKRIFAAVPNVNVLVIDDSSPDGTADVVRELMKDNPSLDLRVRAGKQGLGSAYRFGFREAITLGATALIEMDADLSHEPEALPSLLEASDGGADLVIGSRYVHGGRSPGLSPSRLALSRAGNVYANIALGIGVRDATSGFRVYRPELIEKINLDTVSADGYGFQIEMVFRSRLLGATIREVAIIFHQRTHGTSKMSNDIVKEAMTLCTVWGFQRRARQLKGLRGDFVPYHKDASSIKDAIISAIRTN
ncbi:MAG: polyprenol monophosphomannose synthase [Actinomycetota bacterium]|nr:polyprenol monophosphomannose synthase [Actinomycetota bacterium]